MMKHIRIGMILALAAFLAGCQGPCDKLGTITAPTTTSGSADFSTYVAVGTSISAGYQSGGLVDRHQVRSFPALFAQAIGKTVLQNGQGQFTFPAVDHDGIPALTHVASFSPLVITSAGATTGAPENFAQATPYHNMAIPGALLIDFADTTNYYATKLPPAGIGRTNFTMFNIVTRHRGSVLQQVLALRPTFMTFEYGSNEVLGAATAGSTAYLFPSAVYTSVLTQCMNAIHTYSPGTKVALFNVPNVTSIPFCTTFKPYTRSLTTGQVVTLLGPGRTPLSPTDLVLLTAADSLARGTGFPIGAYNYVNPAAPGNGRPLLDSQVLSTTEQATIGAAITAMNAAVDSVATRPWIAKVDFNGLLSGLATNGYDLGSVHYSTAFVTGGIFSLDGVHPTDLGHAIGTNALIAAVNARFGSTIQPLTVSKYTTSSASRMVPVTEDGLPSSMELHGIQDGLQMLFPWRR